MVRTLKIGLAEALRMTLERISPKPSETVHVHDGVDRIVAATLAARVDSPSVDASLKDGFAVLSRDVDQAGPSSPVRLRLSGRMAAGGSEDIAVVSGTTVRVLTGARIPRGADAVVSEEFVARDGDDVLVGIPAEPGRNILPRGADVVAGNPVVKPGDRLTPGMVGLLAAAGHSHVAVVGKPVVAIVATGDEVVAPGVPLPEGKLYASNMTTLGAWCRRYGMGTRLSIVRDDGEAILDAFRSNLEAADVLVTSGGAWTGDRDMVVKTLDRLGWEKVFHRIRIGPGKAVGFGLLGAKPVFILPGGPPSNLMGFLQIALPGLLRLSGDTAGGLPTATVRLARELTGRYADWTQFVFGTLEAANGAPAFHPLVGGSRLRSMAEARAVVAIPEGATRLPARSLVTAQLLA